MGTVRKKDPAGTNPIVLGSLNDKANRSLKSAYKKKKRKIRPSTGNTNNKNTTDPSQSPQKRVSLNREIDTQMGSHPKDQQSEKTKTRDRASEKKGVKKRK